MHLLHLVRARDLINQLAKKLISSLAISPASEGKTAETESTTSVTMTVTIFSCESSCLANCRPLHVSVHCCLFLYSLSKKLVFVPVASAMIAVHRDHLVLASNNQWPDIRSLTSRGQIVSADLP